MPIRSISAGSRGPDDGEGPDFDIGSDVPRETIDLDPDAPPQLRRDLFANDETYRAAQDAVDAEFYGEASPSAAPVSFVTAKGSSYRIEDDGTTSRDKAYRAEHGVGEQGPQPRSQVTYYVSADDAIALAEFQAQGGPKVAIEALPDGRIGVRYLEGKDKGKFEKRTVVTPRTDPDIGLTPVELWNDGKRVHFGNPIVSINRGEQPPPQSPQAYLPGSDATIAKFDDPEGAAVAEMAAMLTHDVRADLDAGALDGVLIDFDGQAVNAQLTLDLLDAEDAAIAAVEACL
jgi:hypothetical protein